MCADTPGEYSSRVMECHPFLFINLAVSLHDVPDAAGRCSSSNKLCNGHLCWGLFSVESLERGPLIKLKVDNFTATSHTCAFGTAMNVFFSVRVLSEWIWSSYHKPLPFIESTVWWELLAEIDFGINHHPTKISSSKNFELRKPSTLSLSRKPTLC